MKTATQHNAAGGGAVRASATAAVVLLASADGPAIQQNRPRGPRPKHVLSLSLWRARLDRSQAVTVLALQAQLALVQQAQKECYQRGMVLWANLKEAERLDKLGSDEYDVLNQQIATIKAQIAQAAIGGAA